MGIMIITVIFFSYDRILPLGLVSYFVAGALIMKYRFNATGVDVIPNRKFWTSLPFLIKVYCNKKII